MPLIEVVEPSHDTSTSTPSKGRLVEVAEPSVGQRVKKAASEAGMAAASGFLKGGASTLQVGQNIIDIARKYSPNQVIDTFLSERIPGYKVPPPVTFLGDEAQRGRAYAESIAPESSVLNEVVSGVAQAPAIIGQVAALGGGVRGLAAQGLLERYNEGITPAVKQAALNTLLGVVSKGVSKIRPGLSSTSKITPAVTAAARVGTGAAVGAGTSALQGDDPDRVVAQGILGGVTAAPASPRGNLLDEAKRAAFKLKKPELEVKALKNIRAKKEGALKEQKATVKAESEMQDEQIDTAEKVAKQYAEGEATQKEMALKQKADYLKAQQAEELQASKQALNTELDDLALKTNTIVKDKAVSLQPKMQEMFRQKGRQYDEHYERVAANVDENTPITRGDVYNILLEAKQDSIADADINFGRPFESINRLIDKYALESVDPKTGERVIYDPSEQIAFKDFRKDLKKVEKQVDFKGRPKPEDIPYHILKSKSGDFLAKLDGSFSELQAHYSEVIKAMNRATKSFATYKGKFETEGAENTLKKIASGETSGGLDRTLQFLEKGTEQFPGGLGEGEFAELKSKPAERAALEKRAAESQEKTRSNYMKRMSEVDKDLVQLSRELNERTEMIRGRSEGVRKQIAETYMKRIEALEKEFNDSVVTSSPSQGKYALDWRIKQAQMRANRFSALKRIVYGSTSAGAFLGVGATRAAAGRAANIVRDEMR